MVPDLKEAFQVDNLRRAWRWLNTNDDAYFKGFFRHIYSAYAIALDENLDDLHNRLRKETFQPTHATKIYLPKKSGIQRTYTLLTVEDQIVYQALTNVVAERLLPRVVPAYYKEVFGNLYAGQHSKCFYRPWRKGYRKFGDAIRNAYQHGFVYTASFDLTACYDSIDHSVLRHFLLDLGIEKEFIDLSCEYLRHWTAALAENRIYQGHGIPQGPLSSGLMSEGVLRYFDENHSARPRQWRYFRYVDDIRFFAKNEHDLRALLVEMDLLSKQVGLFPQSSKIGIKRVTDIEEEIKSISHPPEPFSIRVSPDQRRVRQRLKELTPRFEVANETRFKYVLGSALPNAALSERLLRILAEQPHLYVSIFNYFGRYDQITKRVSTDILAILRDNGLYAAFTAAGLRTLRDHCHPDLHLQVDRFVQKIVDNLNAVPNSELRAAAVSVLLAHNRMKWPEVEEYFAQEPEWWPRSEVIRYVQADQFGDLSFESLVNELLSDSSVDVSVVAAELLAERSLTITRSIDAINPVAQLALKKMGFIQVRRSRLCPISAAMQQMLDARVEDITWKKLLGRHYDANIQKVMRIRAFSETDATEWVNMLDAFHDDLLDSLFQHESGAIGGYTHGKIGGALGSSTSAFAIKYPRAYKTLKNIHQKRLQSPLSHSVTRTTGRRTQFIKFDYVTEMKPKLVKAYLEIWSKW